MLSLPQELILTILEYSGNKINIINCDDISQYLRDKLRNVFNLWKTCKHFDYLKDKYYTIIGEFPGDVSILTFKLLNPSKLYGYQYGFTTKYYSPKYLTYCHYFSDGVLCENYLETSIKIPVHKIIYINNYHEILMDNIANQIYNQWNNVDGVTKTWLLNNNSSILIRDSISTNKYNINLANI